MSAAAGPRTDRGRRTRQKLIAAAEAVFGRDGYHRASIVDITREAGVGQGTFYLYFPGKEALFVELVRDMGHQMRRALHDGTAGLTTRAEAERVGLSVFFEFVAAHPAMYRIVRECQFVAEEEYRAWYRQLGDGYVRGIGAAMDAGEFRQLDPETVAYCLMGISDFLGMRLLLWEGRKRVPDEVVETVIDMVLNGLLAAPARA